MGKVFRHGSGRQSRKGLGIYTDGKVPGYMGIWETSATSVGAEAPKLAGDETAAAVREAARRNRKGGVTTEAVGETSTWLKDSQGKRLRRTRLRGASLDEVPPRKDK